MLIKGSTVRHAAWPIDKLFVDRWSPRAMNGEALSHAELMTLLEAARWAPSSYNVQPWRMLYALRATPHWPVYLDLLNENNRAWAVNAGAIVLFISQREHDGKSSITHSFDTGAAWQNVALQAYLNNLAVHGIQGFNYERAREVLRIPETFRLEAMAVIGRPGDKSALPENLLQREKPNDRRPLEQTACEGLFSL